MAYLTQTRSKGKVYIYLQEYKSDLDRDKKYQNIFGFGRKEQVLEKMKRWKVEYPKNFPLYLLELGFGEKDLDEWINTLETGRTKTGRSTKI